MRGSFSAGVIFAFAVLSLAQVREPGNVPEVAAPKAETPVAPSDMLPPGTLLHVELLKSVDTKRSKVNDRIEARTVSDLLAHGQIIIPRNTKIIGHVTQARARGKTSPDSTVGIIFDRVLLKSGEVLLPLTIKSIAPPVYASSNIGREPDSLADRSTMPGRLPSVGAPAPPGGSSSLPPDYPDNIPAPPSINAGGPSNSPSRAAEVNGISVDTSGPTSVLSSKTGNLHLDSGTRLLLRVQ